MKGGARGKKQDKITRIRKSKRKKRRHVRGGSNVRSH